jgi:two-component system, chemotaxis family, chemotaxis protein CheY
MDVAPFAGELQAQPVYPVLALCWPVMLVGMTDLQDAYKTLKILVIDDEPEVRRTICRMLEHLGVISIFEAEDGDSGYREVLSSRPDIVLCDVHMEPVDGQEFLKRIRGSESDWVREQPVLILSGDHLLDTVRVATQRHADGYIVKPMMLDQLKTQLDILITRLAERRARRN